MTKPTESHSKHDSPPPDAASPTNAVLVRRLLKLSWEFRAGCIRVICFQLVLLILGLAALNLTGLGVDYVAHRLDPTLNPPLWPFGVRPQDDANPIKVLAVISGCILALAGVRTVLQYFYQKYSNILIQGQIVTSLRDRIFRKLQRLSFRFFDANATGSIINRVTSDVQMVRGFVDGVLIQSGIMFLSLFVYLWYMMHIHVSLTFACLASVPVMWTIAVIYSRRVRPLHRRNRELVDQMISTFSESIQGIQVVKGFAREEEEFDKFKRANLEVRDQQQRIFWGNSLFVPGMAMLTQVNLFVLLAYGGSLFIRGEIPLGGGLMVFAGLLQQFSGQVNNLANITDSVQRSLIGARRVFEVLDTPIEIQSPPNAIRLKSVQGKIEFENVCFEYAMRERVLHQLNFTVQPGQMVAILGATGSGKSALMSLIPRFYDPTSGRIRIDGHDLKDVQLEDLRRKIGLVFQESFLFNASVSANIAFGHPEATRTQIEKAARIAAAHDFISSLPRGYDTLIQEAGSNLSGGQRQRLAIARAVLLEPAILLLDDPTAAIDSETEHEILEAIDQAVVGRTTFIVAHRLSTLRRADLILVLEDGHIVQQGSHEELMKLKGPYHRVAVLQLNQDDSREILETDLAASRRLKGETGP